MPETNNNIKELKKITKKLRFLMYANLIIGILSIIIYVANFTEYSISKDMHPAVNLIWLVCSAFNLHRFFASSIIVKQSENIISLFEKEQSEKI